MSSVVEDVANKLADMPGQTLGIYGMQFPSDVINCIAIFPSDGEPALHYTALGTLDYPGAKIQVRCTDPYNAFSEAEKIRAWLDVNPPTGYYSCRAADLKDITNEASLSLSGGPSYVFEIKFILCKVRA